MLGLQIVDIQSKPLTCPAPSHLGLHRAFNTTTKFLLPYLWKVIFAARLHIPRNEFKIRHAPEHFLNQCQKDRKRGFEQK
jgi:hypothetical protein